MTANPSWYWKAADGRIYSGAAASTVPAADAGYVAWLAAGHVPTVWPTDASGLQTLASIADQAAAVFAPSTPSVPALAAALIAAATAACASLTIQVVPDVVHQNGYVNAFAVVGPGAVVPTVEPTKSAFAAQAAAAGVEPAAFAAMVVAIAAVSCQLQAAQATLTRAAAAAKTVADLAAALAAFETALAAIVAAITTAGVSVTAPAAITVPGLAA